MRRKQPKWGQKMVPSAILNAASTVLNTCENPPEKWAKVAGGEIPPIDLLEDILENTREATKGRVTVEEEDTSYVRANTTKETPKQETPAVNVPPNEITEKQMRFIDDLRMQARQLNLNDLANTPCLPYVGAARVYIQQLLNAIEMAKKNPPVIVQPQPFTQALRKNYTQAQKIGRNKPATPTQWALIKHLRERCYAVGLGAITKKTIDRTIGAADMFIKEMKAALASVNQPQTNNGGLICSKCYQPGCNIGPMIRR